MELESRTHLVFVTSLLHFAKHLAKLKFQALLFRDSMGWGLSFLASIPQARIEQALYLALRNTEPQPLPSVSLQPRGGD